MKMRTEGNGLRATAIILGKSHATIIGWEKHLAEMEKKWSPAAPNDGDGTLEGDEEGLGVEVSVTTSPLPSETEHETFTSLSYSKYLPLSLGHLTFLVGKY